MTRLLNKAVGVTYVIDVNGHTAKTIATPFPSFFWYVMAIDVFCLIGTAIFIRWIAKSD